MNEQQLFLKYNLKNTEGYTKNIVLNELLFNNAIINNSPPNTKWTILLHGTYNCNANCIYCEHESLRKIYKNKIISKELIKQIVYKLGPNAYNITWHGGESLLLPNDILETLTKEREKYNLNFKITLQTNGILLDKNKEKFLTEDLDIQVGSSFDGLFNTKNRGALSTTGVLNLIKRGNPHKIGHICVYTKESIYSLIENYEYCKNIGLTYIQSCPVRENVIDASNPYIIQNDILISELLKYIKYWIYDINNPIEDIYIIRQIGRILGDHSWCESIDCSGQWLIIDPNGNIATCGMFPQEDYFDNIQNINSYTDLLNNPKYIYHLYQKKQLYLNNCKDCKYLSVCYGGCMGLNYEQNHNYQQINQRNCEFTQKLLDNIYDIIKDLDLTDINKYNPYFISILKNLNYYSLSEIKQIERDLTYA